MEGDPCTNIPNRLHIYRLKKKRFEIPEKILKNRKFTSDGFKKF
jgi:hypothetical protein